MHSNQKGTQNCKDTESHECKDGKWNEAQMTLDTTDAAAPYA